MKPLILRADFNGQTGYGQLINTVALELPKLDIDLLCIPLSNFVGKHVPDEVQRRFIPEARNPGGPELLIHPLNFTNEDPPIFSTYKAENAHHFTMWESSRIRPAWANLLNENRAVMVPNKWNRNNFIRDGVKTPIHVVPLCVDTSIYEYSTPHEGPFVVGCGGNLTDSGIRKKLEETVYLFSKAFPTEKDVRLRVKVNQAVFPRFSDPRIEVVRDFISQEELRDWYHSIHVFASLSNAEGWGLMQHQAMACGRPVIAAKYAGLAEFFDESVGYPVTFEEVWARGFYQNSGGLWAECNPQDFIDKLKWCYKHRNDTAEKGKLAAVRAAEFSVENMINKLMEPLWERILD